ncbi:MAG: FG-GAP repeat-containing protein, partial [Acidimicrobiaceae bacterium]
MATSNYGTTFAQESISVLPGSGNGSFPVPQLYFAMYSQQYGGCAGIEAVDVDLDGHLDLIAGAYGADDLVLLRNLGDGTFDAQQRYGVSGVVRYVKAARLNGDTRPDIALSITKDTLQPAMTFLFGLPATAITDLGNGLAGANGVPALAGEGTLQPGSSITLSLSGALANAPATLVIGLSQLGAPFKGGVLVPSPDLLLGGFVTGAGG